VGTVGSGERTALERTLVRVCTALRAAGVPYALTGGSGIYARGGPLSEHDIDVLVRPSDADDAVRALVSAGMRATDAPEDWLRKVYDDTVPVDLIYRPAESPVTDDTLAAAEELPVASVQAPVASATDILADKLLSLGAQYCDFGWVLPAARALREQVDWKVLRARTQRNPYAEAFLLLAERLGISTSDSSGSTTAMTVQTPQNDAPQYLVARLRRALTEDPRTAEQGVRVRVHGQTVQLSGQVATVQRRDALTAVVAECAPGMIIRNDVRVVAIGQPAEWEELR
jgi:hypothetical protein